MQCHRITYITLYLTIHGLNMNTKLYMQALTAGLVMALPIMGCSTGVELEEGQEFGGTIARSYE